MSFSEKSGYPTWENFIPTFKAQTLIMSIMSELAYEVNYKLTGAILDDNNYVKQLGTMIFFTAKGRYKVLQPDCGHDRLRISYADGSLVSRYYQYPVPGVNPNKFANVVEASVTGNVATLVFNIFVDSILIPGDDVVVSGFEGTDALYFNTAGSEILSVNGKEITYVSNLPGPYEAENPELGKVSLFDFDNDYKPGLPPVYGDIAPLYNQKIPCPIDWPPASFPSLETIAYCVPNPGQPFLNRSKISPSISANVYGYFKPPPPPCKNDPYVIAFHCIFNSRAASNNPLDTLQYFQFQTLAIRRKGVTDAPDFGDGVDMVNEQGDLIDRDGNPIEVMYYLNEVDYFKEFDGEPNPTYGYNLSYNSFCFSFRGSTYLPDFLEEIIPPEIIIPDLQLSNPDELLKLYRPWLVNKATAMYKSIAKTTNFDYFLTPFPEEESIQILKNYSIYLGSICFTGHSYGGSLANILAQYLVERFPLYVNAQTYSFAPVPIERPCVPELDPDFYEGLLFVRNFTNCNDGVPFLKVPNILNQPEDYLQPLKPKELYVFYHIKEECNTYTIENIDSYCFPNGGIPIYLAINKDHDYETYTKNISKINPEQFRETVLSDKGVENFTIPDSVIIKTFAETIPLFPYYIKRTEKIIGASVINPFNFTYRFIGLNNVCVNFKNLISSLKL